MTELTSAVEGLTFRGLEVQDFVALVPADGAPAIVPRPLDPPAVAELRPALRRRVGLVHRGMQLAPAARAFVDLALGEVERGSARPPARRRHPPPRRSS